MAFGRCVVALLLVRSGGQTVFRNERHTQKLPGPMAATCVVNSFAGFMYIQQMGLTIANSVGDCKSPARTQDKEICASDVFGVIQCFFNSASYISGLVSQCSNIPDADAECVSTSLSFIGNLMELLQGLLSILKTCGSIPNAYSEGNVDHGADSRRLMSDDEQLIINGSNINGSTDDSDSQELGGAGFAFAINSQSTPAPSTPPTGLNGAWCYLNVASAAVYLAQTGTNIDASVTGCKNTSHSDSQKAECAADISAVIASVSDAVSYIGGAASLCAESINLRGLCTGDAGTIGNALGGLASASSSFLSSCSNSIAKGKHYIHAHSNQRGPAKTPTIIT
mmetsp:Transcript_96833/g.172313  ORF Transcript_96833/g.172313 Transcript_96833/m.172313 type:complete len:338 (+) Transcript_96833:97-1110(+)|eukprot:CAMPEP_0197639080 /NCGR_PEP_ID=MMETSP1338-20131121/13813_1 /TAXON_ID=43686 ORGANISM="Pelagodinium beii, Strain RCC1491" /NCGR_SAMPLE_ID=MMETSP1338 /ASSEMBLY_ACC=CAM_ASM_000754 /LENGTH=337 /DNA_ID=CAMNT_0043211757 /DNA_START=54 /DNA_END=1067 /DNA_ORIENTATION=-